MFRISKSNKKGIAAFFALLLTVQSLLPATAYALTSGPSQPEMQAFQPAGAGDMVDLFSGDFKYDIPLMDVGGYPVNLAYHSGGNMEDEAGWVGMGWSLNPGVVNRTMRGLPDDFTGDKLSNDQQDLVKMTTHRKPFKKIGGQLVLKPTAFAWEFGKASLHLGVYKDNYYGVGGEVGASISFNTSKNSSAALTAGLGLNSDSRTGVTLSPSFSLSTNYDDFKELNNVGLSGGFAYNTRSGLQQVNLGMSYTFHNTTTDDAGKATSDYSATFDVGSFTKYFNHSYTPSFSVNTANSSQTYNLDLGPQFFGGYAGVGGSAYIYNEEIVEPHSSAPAYGYLNYTQGKKNVNALLDFNREKDEVFKTGSPAIPIPVATEDYFEATSQAGAQQFRPFYTGNYAVFDRTFTNTSQSTGGGLTIGAGNAFQGGARVDVSSGNAVTHEWTAGNLYLASTLDGPPLVNFSSPLLEQMYFKKVGEQTLTDPTSYSLAGGDAVQRVAINSKQSPSTVAVALPIYQTASGTTPAAPIQRTARDIRTSTFSYLTAKQASVYGLDKKINGANRVDGENSLDPAMTVHKAHHISEVTVTDNEGKRMVYGIPVYNMEQQEVSFSVGAPSSTVFESTRKTGLIGYSNTDNSESNGEGRENIYTKKVIPPYATSYLLTGILSPDYVDRKGDGITDDDEGTAVKFSYNKSGGEYKWRAPYEQNKVSYNEGFLSDNKDDKGNYVYGRKETWYLHTIESKTMVAQFFTSSRDDGLGVLGPDGGPDASVRLMKLDSIRLFSKADLVQNGSNAVPIKVAHFEYDYSLYPNVPNNVNTPTAGSDPGGNTGKLTLKKVYFTFGQSLRGMTNPYLFTYDMRLIRDNTDADRIDNLPGSSSTDPADVAETKDQYTQRQSDRWGTYKQSFYNRPSGGLGLLNNSEYPYSLQVTDNGAYDERKLADRFASKWQLNNITTPTGGIIRVVYESDDYSYVQDRKAMVMCRLTGVGASGQATGLINASKLYVTLPVGVSSVADFTNTYLSGPDGQSWNNVFFKVRTDIDNKGHWEYVYGYAELDLTPSSFDYVDAHTIGIPVKSVSGYNPVAKTAWQMLQNDLPQYAYENYDNSDVSSFGQDVAAAVRSIIQSFANLNELFESFDKTASGKKYANKIDPDRSFIRLNYPAGKTNGGSYAKHTFGKLGGGARVRSVEISDEWKTMTNGTDIKKISYGQQYDYMVTDDKGNTMSSGVASYEPQIGNEENPFHEPINYTEKVEWGADRYHFIEKPFGESYYPGPAVGYSQVKVTNYGADYTNSDTDPVMHTNNGYTVSEFYTSRDFPTRVDYLPLDQENYQNNLTLLLFASSFIDRMVTSQGFRVVLNDMHGRQKSTKIFDKGGAMLSSSEYFYNVNDDNAINKQLNNKVLTAEANGNISTAGQVVGTDEELVTDMRESVSDNSGSSASAYFGATLIGLFPFAFGSAQYNSTSSIRSYNSISSLKVIHQYGILREVRTTQNGSTISARNLLWDGQTGDVLLTQTQNEFNDYTYAFHYPAYWGYQGMDNAYKNIGAVFSGLATGSDGRLLSGSSSYSGYLYPGDELVDIDDGTNAKGWIISSSDGSKRLIDKDGNFMAVSGNFMVLRSGKRNLLNASAGTVVSMVNPLVMVNGAYQLQPGVDKKVLDTKAMTYKDEWAMPVKSLAVSHQATVVENCIPYHYFNNDNHVPFSNTTNFYKVLFSVNPNTHRRYIYSYAEDNVTLKQLMDKGIDMGLFTTDIYTSFMQSCVYQGGCHFPDPSLVKYYLYTKRTDPGNSSFYVINPVDRAYIGTADQVYGYILFNAINSTMNTLLNNTIGGGPSQCLYPSFNDCSNPSDAGTIRNTFSASACSMDPDVVNPVDMSIDWVSSAYPFPTDGPPVITCENPVSKTINPYYQGVKGNWRPDYSYVYQVNRVQAPGVPNQNGGTNIRASGYYSSFTPFWNISGGALTNNSNADSRWVWSNHPIFFDQKGNEVETVDALNRYGAALYGYSQSVATAVASNARYNEIAFDGFEDYYFTLQDNTADPDPCPLLRHLDMGMSAPGSDGKICGGGNCIVTDKAHSGRYSLKLSSLQLTNSAGNAAPVTPFLGFDPSGRYLLLDNEQANGFAPVNGKKYLFSVWVNDNSPQQNTINGLEVSINGSSRDISSLTVPVVEGWKKLDLSFNAGASFSLQLTGSGNIYIDDLRLMPYDSQLKSFVYDDRNMRLVGQLDENNFAVFYEYDEEGTPVRIKKETERGIMTIKENRQSFRQTRPNN